VGRLEVREGRLATDGGPRHVAVVGGGFAGLACAVRLARAGARVTLLERRPFLGGRAYSFADPATGDVVDNGPHLLAGAYTETLDFLHEIGALDRLAFQPRLDVRLAHRRLGWGAVSAPPVPGPLQAPAALLGYRLLPRADRLRVMAGALRLGARGPAAFAGTTVAEALDAVGQSPAACQRFWHPLVIATLNEEPGLAAAAPFAAVLRRLFLAGARAARFALARGPLGELYTGDARRVIEGAGGTIATGATVASVALRARRATGLVLRDGRFVGADAVVVAVPCAALLRLLPPVLAEAPPFRALGAVGTSPIVSVHLWLDRAVGWGAPFVGLLDARAQWLFDHGTRLASVTSGARFWDEAPDDAIAAEVLADARGVLPALDAATVRRSLVVRERHATFSLTPAADAVRPPAETPVANLFLAGDWTATGLPATIEGAVVSGRRAAARALAAASVPAAGAEPGRDGAHA
jgi:zeta-carotene desaturase